MLKKALLAATALMALATGALAEDLKEFRIGILGGENAQDRMTSNECYRAKIEEALGVPVKVFTPADYDGVIQGLLGGTLDVVGLGASGFAAVCLQDPNAVEPFLTNVQTDGSTGYYSVALALADSGITSIAQLNGKKVATTTGTTSVQLLRKHERGAGVNFEEVFGKDHADSFLLLESGRADAFVMDGQILAGNIAKSKAQADYKIVGEVLSVEPIAIMIRKDDPAFKKAVDDSLKGMMKSGEMAKLYDKWFMQPIPPNNVKIGLPASDATKAAWANPNDKPMEEYTLKD